jgi:hypothetical protein
MRTELRYYGIWLAGILTIVLGLSVLAGVPYIWSICGLSAWAAFGHLITIDDEAPGGWSNPEESQEVWRGSLRELAVKFVILAGLVWLTFAFPALSRYGGKAEQDHPLDAQKDARK